MTDPKLNPPLWRVMHDAANAALSPHQYIRSSRMDPYAVRIVGMTRAAELRAVADWLPSSGIHLRPDDMQKVVAAIRAEADRAEAGE